MRVFTLTARWGFMLCLPVLLLTASIAWAVNSQWLYTSGFERYNVSQATGLARSELERVATGLRNYFNSGEEYVNVYVNRNGQTFELFDEEEKIHFRDVKGLFWLDYWVLLGTGIYSLAYAGVSLWWRRRRYWRQLAWGMVWGSSLTLSLMLVLGLATWLGFDQLFLQFHLISFTNEFWSTEGYMRLLFPRDFWYNVTILCGSISAVLAVILGGVAGGYLIFVRKAERTGDG